MAALCWSVHYAKRLLETLFVHRFSHATMPVRNLFKNCSYYWFSAIYVAYYVNHPLYIAPSEFKFYVGLTVFTLCELGNLSIHFALRNLRQPGTTTRKIPLPTTNPFTSLFYFVSCPNYTYEIGSWIGFTIMTSCLPGIHFFLLFTKKKSRTYNCIIIIVLSAAVFTLAGAYQMTVWAIGKHKAYKKEFSQYPKSRKAIFPFIL